MDMATRLNPGSPPVRTRKYRHLSSSRQLGLTCWKTSNKGPGYPNKNFSPVFRVSCRQPWTGTRRKVASRVHKPSIGTAKKGVPGEHNLDDLKWTPEIGPNVKV